MNTLTSRIKHHHLNRNSGKSNWSTRRRIIVLTLLFCAYCVIHILYNNIDTRTAETIVQSAFALAGAVIGAYVFGATWEDRKKMDIIGDEVDNQPQIPPANTNPPSTPPAPNTNNPDVQSQMDSRLNELNLDGSN